MRFILCAALAAFVPGCAVTITDSGVAPLNADRCPVPIVRPDELPIMNLPLEARQKNYGTGGSCVCASTISCLRWQGRDDLADKVRSSCAGGQSSQSLNAKLERLGIRYAYTVSGDVSFLEWACRTRRGSGIGFYSSHYVNLVHLDATRAVLLDNNRVGKYITMTRAEFLRRWRQQYGGWACTVVYSPAPPVAFVDAKPTAR